MYTTIEVLYKDGKILPLKDDIKIKNGKVLITVLEDTRTNVVSESTLRDLLRNKNVFRNLPKDPLTYQRELRDEW